MYNSQEIIKTVYDKHCEISISEQSNKFYKFGRSVCDRISLDIKTNQYQKFHNRELIIKNTFKTLIVDNIKGGRYKYFVFFDTDFCISNFQYIDTGTVVRICEYDNIMDCINFYCFTAKLFKNIVIKMFDLYNRFLWDNGNRCKNDELIYVENDELIYVENIRKFIMTYHVNLTNDNLIQNYTHIAAPKNKIFEMFEILIPDEFYNYILLNEIKNI